MFWVSFLLISNVLIVICVVRWYWFFLFGMMREVIFLYINSLLWKRKFCFVWKFLKVVWLK